MNRLSIPSFVPIIPFISPRLALFTRSFYVTSPIPIERYCTLNGIARKSCRAALHHLYLMREGGGVERLPILVKLADGGEEVFGLETISHFNVHVFIHVDTYFIMDV